MNISIATLLLPALLLVGAGSTPAADVTQSSRSAGKLQQDGSVELSQVLQQSEVVTRVYTGAAENYAARGELVSQEGIANRHDQLFAIYEADVALLSDLDGDGFHHAISVYFDVDVSVDSATVYAKLYLSREGGPWNQYFTTDLFTIHGDEFADAYEVETELLEGYAPGYYDVLVEIYSLDHAFMVTSEVLDYNYLGKDLAIEDLYHDEPWDEPYEAYYEEEFYSSSSGGGSMAALLLVFLFIQFVIAARGSLALSPRNDSDSEK